jgi:uncharacterized membrane protein YhhN
MKPFTIALLVFFGLALVLDCYFIIHNEYRYRYFSKCLLMPFLASALLFQTKHSKHMKSKLILSSGLFFAFLGDLLLLLHDNFGDPDTFIFGIFCFLIAHVAYIFFFYRMVPFSSSKPYLISFCTLLISGYLIYFLSKIWVGITKDDLVVPVILYSLTIGLMVLVALNTINGGRLKKIGYRHFIPGAVLFIASDSILALDKYSSPIPNAGIWVILTYAAAQFLITTGGIRVIRK